MDAFLRHASNTRLSQLLLLSAQGREPQGNGSLVRVQPLNGSHVLDRWPEIAQPVRCQRLHNQP